MDHFLLMLCLTLLSSAFSYEVYIEADEGEDCELPCTCLPEVSLLKWTQLEEESDKDLLINRRGELLEDQHPQFKSRVELNDLSLKNRDCSVILRNVKSEDTGIYRCLIIYEDEYKVEKLIYVRIDIKEDRAQSPHSPDPQKIKTDTDTLSLRELLIGIAMGVFLCILFLIPCKKKINKLRKKR